MIKAVAVDIDGTLTDMSRQVDISVIESIRKLEDMNIPVILVTGNLLCYTRAISVFLGSTGGLIAENGGVLYFNGDIEILGDYDKTLEAYHHVLDNSDLDLVKAEFSDLRQSEITLYKTVQSSDLRDVLKNHDVEVYDTSFALHITDPSVSKGLGLKRIADKLDISIDDVLAIGDSENDISFFNVSGHTGAVLNADDNLKKISDYVSSVPFGKGTVEIIQHFIFDKI